MTLFTVFFLCVCRHWTAHVTSRDEGHPGRDTEEIQTCEERQETKTRVQGDV